MNVLLGHTRWHSVARRPVAERRFDPLVVRAFYDDIETQPANSLEIRNVALRLPAAADGYARLMLVGTTGAGKTSLLRHLIGSWKQETARAGPSDDDWAYDDSGSDIPGAGR